MGETVAERHTIERRQLLADYETTIETSAGAIDEARQRGRLALGEIHDRELWREGGYASWASYCRDRWGMGRSRAYELVQWADQTRKALEAGAGAPSQRQARRERQSARADSSPGTPTTPGDKRPAKAATSRPTRTDAPVAAPTGAVGTGRAASSDDGQTAGRVECPRCHGAGTIAAPQTVAVTGGHCSCKTPTLSKLVTNLCTSCGLVR